MNDDYFNHFSMSQSDRRYANFDYGYNAMRNGAAETIALLDKINDYEKQIEDLMRSSASNQILSCQENIARLKSEISAINKAGSKINQKYYECRNFMTVSAASGFFRANENLQYKMDMEERKQNSYYSSKRDVAAAKAALAILDYVNKHKGHLEKVLPSLLKKINANNEAIDGLNAQIKQNEQKIIELKRSIEQNPLQQRKIDRAVQGLKSEQYSVISQANNYLEQIMYGYSRNLLRDKDKFFASQVFGVMKSYLWDSRLSTEADIFVNRGTVTRVAEAYRKGTLKLTENTAQKDNGNGIV